MTFIFRKSIIIVSENRRKKATDAVNFAEVNTYQEVKVGTQSMETMPVKIASPLPNGISVQMLKGTSVPVNSGDKFQKGVLLHLLVSYLRDPIQ